MIKKMFIALGVMAMLLTLAAVFVLNTRINQVLELVGKKPSVSTPVSTTIAIGDCGGTGACLKFRHESELSLPPLSNSGCPPYKLPVLAKLPAVKELEIGKETPSDQANEILLKYVEKVLDADSASKAALLKDYQDYLAGCTKTQDPTPPPAAAPSTNTK